jgi:hypothetical protein
MEIHLLIPVAGLSGTPPEKKKGTNELIALLSLSAGFVFELSNRFLEDLDKIIDFLDRFGSFSTEI